MGTSIGGMPVIPREGRFPWYLVTGVIVGLAFGLLYAWVLQPVEHIDTFPSSLQNEYKEAYRALVASAYVADGDLGRAKARLALLGDDDPVRTLSLQAQQALSRDDDDHQARALGILAAALGSGSAGTQIAALAPTSDGSSTPKPDLTSTPTTESKKSPTPTLPPAVTRTPTPTQSSGFKLREFVLVCEPELAAAPLIQVYLFDAANQPVPGVEIIVSWEEGEDRFFSGLKPEFGLGYADFTMQPGIEYTVRLAAGGDAVPGLTPVDCQGEDGSTWLGTWRVNYIQE